jgi:SAM-dependent methyltransferase
MPAPPTGDPAASSQAFYDSMAGDFQAQCAFWDNPYDREIWRLQHDLLRTHLPDSGPLLDIGCGFTPHSDFGRGRTVVAGDISFQSLVVARHLGDESRVVRLCQFDARALPFPSRSFGAVIAGGEVLNHIHDYEGAVREMARVLRPTGILLIQVAGKWCLDSLWALLDAGLGHRIGYAMTREEAVAFLRRPWQDASMTCDIAHGGRLRVQLLSIASLREVIRVAGLRVLTMYGAHSVSGMLPLPLQQESRSPLVHSLTSLLIRLDRFFGRFAPFRSFAGNVFLVCSPRTLGSGEVAS